MPDLAHQIISGYGYSLGHDHFIASSGQPTSIVEPAYPLLVTASYLLFGECFLPVRLLQAVFGAATCAFIYVIGRRAINEATGRVAASLSAVYPLFVMYTRPLLTEIISCFVLAVCVWQIYRLVERPSAWNFFLGGVLV
ncbi:MAG TPA: hypothetical protein EYP19_07125, partial [Desulfobacterales bacterium]|nr:hypothetical protein [Desulfobacterales bacterium]